MKEAKGRDLKSTLSNQLQIANNMLPHGIHPVKWPSYNRAGYAFGRVARLFTALQLQDPVDVPCWNFWLERYIPGVQFWAVWKYMMNEQGESYRDLEDLIDDALNGPLTESYKGGTVLKQVAVLRKLYES